ncbi:MAG TPA: PAS domain-containing protein [Stellaceae bacterium]|nr:PAS domain-containing protein [Stellaceae bacterium]
MGGNVAIGDQRLALLYQYWRSKRGARAMPAPEDIHPAELPRAVQPNLMLLEVVRGGAEPRFRYSHVGGLFWRAGGSDPVGTFVDEILPTTAGYRDYVVGIYREMEATGRPMYTENAFILQHGQSDPMSTKRVSLPLSSDGRTVSLVLAAHVFDYGANGDSDAFALVTGLREEVRAFLA